MRRSETGIPDVARGFRRALSITSDIESFQETFSTEKELAKLAADWLASRLVETWNSCAGVAPFDDLKPVKKFTSRAAAVSRLWTAVQRLSPDVALRAERVAPTKGKAKKSPAKSQRRARAQKCASEERVNKRAQVILLRPVFAPPLTLGHPGRKIALQFVKELQDMFVELFHLFLAWFHEGGSCTTCR